MAEIAQLQQITNSMASSYGGVTGRGSMKNITPGANVMSASEVAIDEQTSVLEDVRELQQQQLQQAFLTNTFLAKSFQLEMDKDRRAREQGAEMRKELSKMTGAGAVAGSLGMAGGGLGLGGSDESSDEGGGSNLIDLATTGVATVGGVTATKAIVSGVTGGTTGTKEDKDSKDTKKAAKDLKDGKKTGNKAKIKNALKLLSKSKYVKGFGLLGAVTSAISIFSELSDVGAARATGDEELIREEERDVAEAVGGATGAVGGAITGAAIGSVIPVIGTFIGGLVGGTLGYFGGDIVGGGLFDIFKSGGDKKKQQEEEFQAAAAKRIPIKKSALAGRGFNHKKVETYWFGKAPNGNWLVYKDQYARSPMGYVEDPELIDFLEGKISELPNLAEQIKADKEVMESNSVVPADPLEGSTQTTDLTKTQTPKVKTGKIGDAELTSFDDSNLVDMFNTMSLFGDTPELDKYSFANPPKELVDRVTGQLGENHYKLDDKIMALNAKRLTMVIPELLNSMPPSEIEARGKLQNSLEEAQAYLNDPSTQEALTEGETFKDKILGFFSPKSQTEAGRARQVDGNMESMEYEKVTDDGVETGSTFTQGTSVKTSGFLNNILADKGEKLESFLATFEENIQTNGKDKHRRTDIYVERLKGGMFGGDIYKVRELSIDEDGERVALQSNITIDKKTFKKLKEASASDTPDKVDQMASVTKQLSLGMLGERESDFENLIPVDMKPTSLANNTNNLAPIDTGGGGSVNVVNNQPSVNNTSQNQVTNNTASLDTTQDPYKDKQQHTF